MTILSYIITIIISVCISSYFTFRAMERRLCMERGFLIGLTFRPYETICNVIRKINGYEVRIENNRRITRALQTLKKPIELTIVLYYMKRHNMRSINIKDRTVYIYNLYRTFTGSRACINSCYDDIVPSTVECSEGIIISPKKLIHKDNKLEKLKGVTIYKPRHLSRYAQDEQNEYVTVFNKLLKRKHLSVISPNAAA